MHSGYDVRWSILDVGRGLNMVGLSGGVRTKNSRTTGWGLSSGIRAWWWIIGARRTPVAPRGLRPRQRRTPQLLLPGVIVVVVGITMIIILATPTTSGLLVATTPIIGAVRIPVIVTMRISTPMVVRRRRGGIIIVCANCESSGVGNNILFGKMVPASLLKHKTRPRLIEGMEGFTLFNERGHGLLGRIKSFAKLKD